MMKVRLLTITFVCAYCIVAHAQTSQNSYHPFEEEGKIWDAQVGIIRENIFVNKIEGDTVINGENWKKVYNFSAFGIGGGYTYYLALREVGQKVYAIAKGSNRPRLLYDFGLKVGDTVRCGVEGNAFGCLLDTNEKLDTLMGFAIRNRLKVKSIDTIHVNAPYTRESYLRRFTFTLLDAYREPLAVDYEIVWVEGVGSGAGPFSPWQPLLPFENFLLECTVDKIHIFGYPYPRSYEIFTTNIGSPQYKTTGGMGFYNLQGHKLNALPQNGVYIQNGKKIIGK